MSGTIPPIPPPFGASSGNLGSPNVNRVDTMPATTDPINTTNTKNMSQIIVDENLPQLLDSRGGSHVTNVPAFDKEDFTSWKVRFLVFLDGLEPYLLKTLEDGPFLPMLSLSTSNILCLNVKINGQMLRVPNIDWDDESVSSDDEGSTKIRAFMAIEEDEPSVGKVDTNSGQRVDITMKKVHRLLFMTDGDERKHVLDYTHVDLHYVEDQRKNLSLGENESLKDEIVNLKKVIEKWTYTKVTLDQLLSEQVPGNIVKALGRKDRRKEKISSKEVVITKADESSSKLAPEITSDSESECAS
ncbi:hypothetical protein Tco_0200495 [Tanacetum coccineum]